MEPLFDAQDGRSEWQRTSKKQVAIPPRLALPSHEEEDDDDSGYIPLTLSEYPISPAIITLNSLKRLALSSSRPIAAIAEIAPHPLLDTGAHSTATGPRLLSLPSRPTEKHPVPPRQTHPQTSEHPIVSSSLPSIPAIAAVPTPPKEIEEPKSAKKSKNHKKKHLRKVPEMRQMTAVECGAACLAMILNYYGYATGIAEVEEHCGVGRDGLSAGAIARAARQYGMQVRAVSIKDNDLKDVSMPAIIHWQFNHFMVIERWSKNHVDVIDPASGRKRIPIKEFEASFTGVVIMLEPGPRFANRPMPPTLTLWKYMLSILSMRGVVVQIVIASLLLQMLGLGIPLLTQVILDHIIPEHLTSMLLLLGLGALMLLVAQGITQLLRASLLIYLQTRLDTRMMLSFFEHLLSLPYSFFQRRLNGDLLTRLGSNTIIRELITNQGIATILDSSTLIIYLVVLLWQSSQVAIVVCVVGAIQAALLLITAPVIRTFTQRDLTAQGKTQGYLNEVLSGIATLKAAGAEQQAFDRWINLYFEQMNISTRKSYLFAFISTILEFLHAFSPLLLLWMGAVQVISGTMTVGTMLALNTLAIAFLVPLSSLVGSSQKMQMAKAHFERIADVLTTASEQDVTQAQTPPRLSGKIELNNVGFQYAANTTMVLQDISLRIHQGQKVALVGKSGSGKSTLGKLLIGLITPTIGDILFDNLPLHTLNYRELRKQFGVVLQDSFIFSGSVRENIAFNQPDLKMDAVIQAAQAAEIHADITKMPMNYETMLSEGGSVFSGGQRQRLALARALAHHPAILLLDEATSALDVVTEHAIEENLHRFHCTQIIIAHRLSTIRNADLILVLENGRVVEQGAHDQLMRRSGFYSELIHAQLQKGEIVAA